ncbi:unnamed protein product, partial [marine sediment metagenome]
VALAGLVVPHFQGIRTNFSSIFDPIALGVARAGFTVGEDVGISKLGAGRMNPAHLKRLVSIKKVLDTVLDPDETYLDMSGRSAQYYYFQRRPPIEVGAIYNLVGVAQQMRAIASLKSHRPKAIVIGANNKLFDGGPASLRSPLLYRFVILQPGFVQVSIDGIDWLIARDRLNRLPDLDLLETFELNDVFPNRIHELFKTTDLKYIPASWGRSASTLEPKMTVIQFVNKNKQPWVHSVNSLENGHFLVTGDDPHVRFNVSSWELKGQDAGILGFDFFCEKL